MPKVKYKRIPCIYCGAKIRAGAVSRHYLTVHRELVVEGEE